MTTLSVRIMDILDMQTTTPLRLRQAYRNVAKFKNLNLAKSWQSKIKGCPQILMGDNEHFWVPSTPREASILISDGYEVFPF